MKLFQSVALAICILIASLTAAFAHSKLSRTFPSSGASLTASPGKLELMFKMPARVTSVKLYMDGKEIPVGRPAKMSSDKLYRGKLPTLQPGKYRIEWRALAEDGHDMRGKISFTVKGQ